MAFLLQFFCGLLIVVQDSGELLVFYPLVADKLEAVVCFVLGQISICRINETGGQAVLLLESSISQGGIGGILSKLLGGFSTQGGVQVCTCLVHGSAYILYHGTDSLHIFKDGLELRDIAGHFFRHIYQSAKLLGTGFHDQVGGDHTILIIFIVQEELLHVAGCFLGSLAGEAGGLGYIAAGLIRVDGPIENLRGNNTEKAHGNNRDHDDEAFLLFHRATDFFFLGLLIHLLQK